MIIIQYPAFFIYQRKDILNAKVEPTDEECDWPSDEEEDEEKDEEAKLAVTMIIIDTCILKTELPTLLGSLNYGLRFFCGQQLRFTRQQLQPLWYMLLSYLPCFYFLLLFLHIIQGRISNDRSNPFLDFY